MYLTGLNDNLFNDLQEEYNTFTQDAKQFLTERVDYTLKRIEDILKKNYIIIKNEVNKISYAELKRQSIREKFNAEFGHLCKQSDNIKEFRILKKETEEEQ